MKTIIVTGATSGIGYAVCRALLKSGERVLGVGRTKEHCEQAISRLREETPEADVAFFTADLMQQSQVLRVAEELAGYLDLHCGGALEVLVNNAGGVRSWYATTEEGIEQQFALNHLSSFLLTWRLLPYLQQGGGRVLFTGSDSHRHMSIHWRDIMFQMRYSPLMAYKQSKLCNLLFAGELNRRYRDAGVRAFVVDPGLVNTEIGNKQTGGLVSRFWTLRARHGISPDEAAKTYLYLCREQNPPEALYFKACAARRTSRQAENEQEAQNLFLLSQRLCGIQYRPVDG